MKWTRLMAPWFAVLICFSVMAEVFGEEIDFARDIRPILSDRCFKCHGFDEEARKGDLALHQFATATRDGVIVPGNAAKSEIIHRMLTDDPEDMMPPPSANKPRLTEAEIEKFKKWIDQGAAYREHWAFESPRNRKPDLKLSPDTNPIDHFVGAKLKANDLEFSSQADPVILLRRLHLDLIGLPPTRDEIAGFCNVFSDDPGLALTNKIDELLSRPEYGERWAREWLDLARYSDTNGYEKDRERSIWLYRDWVVNALNADMPYDRFSIEQMAGDMIENATLDQKIASGFHRNTMLNEEGGIDPLEYRYLAMVDRVGTTGLIWLGLTTGCAQCHTHKFDPITHTDFYGMMALLNNADEPEISVPSDSLIEQRNEVLQQIESLEKSLIKKIDPIKYFTWYRDILEKTAAWEPLPPTKMKSTRPHLELMPDGSVFASGDFTKREVYDLELDISAFTEPISALRIEAIPDERLPGQGSGIAYYEGRPGDFFLSEVDIKADGEKQVIKTGSVDYGKIETGFGTAVATNVFDGDATSGWATGMQENLRHELVLNFKTPVIGKKMEVSMLFQRHFAAALGRFRISATTDRGIVEALGGPISDLVKARGDALMRLYVNVVPEFAADQAEIEKLKKQIPVFPTTLVMKEWQGAVRPTHRHHRGEYLQPREEVTPAIPVVFGKLPANQPANRLTFGKWLASDANPLAARVAVNRAWQSFFGRGLVDTAGDYGYQSELPSHPELFDFLAVTFMDEGWSMKKLHRLIVSSRTYQQDSSISSSLLAMDPQNILLARGPRFRMTGEMIRDSLLFSSGLLTQKLGGPSVRPPQPETVTTVSYGAPLWVSDSGPNRYRRSLYTLSKRTAPFAAYLTFDGPTGESCVPRRNRSNTPLQALTLMNDPMFIEAAQAIVQNVAGTDGEIVEELFEKIVTRCPSNSEKAILMNFFKEQKGRMEIINQRSPKVVFENPEKTAWILVARAIMNLDEAVTKG